MTDFWLLQVICLIYAFGVFVPVMLAAQGKLGINPITGLRIRPVTTNARTWQAGHRAALPWAFAALLDCLVGVVGGLVLLAASAPYARATLAPLIAFIVANVALIPIVWAGVRGAQRVLQTSGNDAGVGGSSR